ncbi:uncharacterized protein LOC114191284 [Vigna unguiculata]|uniref:uncharacterized protein LOC114191284 n=1 Tax=Vigna unguiculata TaxID=3917 RepID=UPI001016A799|nr:uncharacterized protein LOC114191284 [Vigna unguiculata]
MPFFLGSHLIDIGTIKHRNNPPFLTGAAMERKEPLDFSSYFCFEASGDSEEADPHEITRAYGGGDDDNDDALSCNYEGSGAALDGEEDECCDDEIAKVGEDEKSGVYGMSYCEDDDEMEEEHVKSHVSFDSAQEFVDEMEKNRLFWEACLAS